jgi:hypothetical protein
MKKNNKNTTQNIGASSKFVLPNSITNTNSTMLRKGKLKRFAGGGVYGDQIQQLTFADGTTPTGATSKIPTKGGMSADTAGAIGQGVSLAASAIPGGDPRGAGAYAKNILGTAGSMAATGAMVGGPWGAAAGAVIGAGIGTVQSISADRAEQERLKKIASAEREAVANQNTGMMQADYYSRNVVNHRVPGLKNGIAKFNSGGTGIAGTNAMVANEEAVKDGNTGKLNVVPGAYNQSNPDQVEANLTQGTSVYSKNPKQTLPFGKSTPADVMARAAKVQKYSDEILSGKNKLSRIDRDTANLNNSNIEAQSRLLNMNTEINNYGKKSVNKYDNGTPGAKITGADLASEWEKKYPGAHRFRGYTTVPGKESGYRQTMASGVNRKIGEELEKLGVKSWNGEQGFYIPNKVADSWYGKGDNPKGVGYGSGTRFEYDLTVAGGNVYPTEEYEANTLPDNGMNRSIQSQRPNLGISGSASNSLGSIISTGNKKPFLRPFTPSSANSGTNVQPTNNNALNKPKTSETTAIEGVTAPVNGNAAATAISNNNIGAVVTKDLNANQGASTRANETTSIGDIKIPASNASYTGGNSNPNTASDISIPKEKLDEANPFYRSPVDVNASLPDDISGLNNSNPNAIITSKDRAILEDSMKQQSVGSNMATPKTNSNLLPEAIKGAIEKATGTVTKFVGAASDAAKKITNQTAEKSSSSNPDASDNGSAQGSNTTATTTPGATPVPNIGSNGGAGSQKVEEQKQGTPGSTNQLDGTPQIVKPLYGKHADYPASDIFKFGNPNTPNANPTDAGKPKQESPAATPGTNKPGTPETKPGSDNTGSDDYWDKSKEAPYMLVSKSKNKDWASAIASLAPVAYNMSRVAEGAETVSPRYARYMNVDKRYNIAPELAEQKRQRNISRYNVAASGAGRNLNAAYASDVYAKGTDQLSKTMATAELANQGYRSEYANLYNQIEGANNAERIRVDDLNMRSRAKLNDFKGKIAEDVSKFAQTQALMQNQKNSDVLQSQVWTALANATDKDTKDYLLRMLARTTGVDFVKVAKNEAPVKKPAAKNKDNTQTKQVNR